MSQYAYLPKNKVEFSSCKCSIANPSTWAFEKNGLKYGGYEEIEFTQMQKDEFISLGGNWFESALDFRKWLNS
jgi:hypothetical protein